MMSEQQFETILAATADLQVAVDATALDVERVIEIISAADSPQPPEWVNGDDDAVVGDAAGEAEVLYPSAAGTPPARGNLGAAAGYVAIAALAAVVVVLLGLLWLAGN